MSSQNPTEDRSPTTTTLEQFSLVLGGPLYQLLNRAHLGDVSSHLRLRILVLSGLCWIPLLLLCSWEGTLLGGVTVPFLLDIESQTRFLISVPLLVFAELIVHQRIRSIVAQFLERRLVPEPNLADFHRAISNAMSWRNSVAAELFLLLLVFSSGYFVRTSTFVVRSIYLSLVSGFSGLASLSPSFLCCAGSTASSSGVVYCGSCHAFPST